MRTTIRHIALTAVLFAIAVAAVGCSSEANAPDAAGDGDTRADATASDRDTTPVGGVDLARPAALAGLPELTLLAPEVTDAGEVPVFRWQAHEQAAAYRLVVLEADGPLWGWSGDGTEVRLGGLDDEPPAAFGGPRLTPDGAYWSVLAIDDTGRPVAASSLRPVAPDIDPPAWTPDELPARIAAAASAATSPADAPDDAAAEPAGPLTACDLLTDDEVQAFIGAEPVGPSVPMQQGDDYSSCDWDHAEDARIGFDISINRKDGAWNPTLWAGDDYESVEGLGDDSFVFSDWAGTRIGFVRDGVTIHLSTGYGSSSIPGLSDLARLADARYQEGG